METLRRKLCRSGPINGVEHPYQPKRRIGCETGGVSIIGATDLKEAREQVLANQNMTVVR